MSEIKSVLEPTPQALKKYFESDQSKSKFIEILGSNAASFIKSVLQLVNSNALFKNCSPESIYGAAMAAAVLNLSIPLGEAYLVPYANKAQFQVG